MYAVQTLGKVHESQPVACFNRPLAVHCWSDTAQRHAPAHCSVSFPVFTSRGFRLTNRNDQPLLGRPPYLLISVLALNAVNSHIINDPNILGTKKLIYQCHQTCLNGEVDALSYA